MKRQIVFWILNAQPFNEEVKGKIDKNLQVNLKTVKKCS